MHIRSLPFLVAAIASTLALTNAVKVVFILVTATPTDRVWSSVTSNVVNHAWKSASSGNKEMATGLRLHTNASPLQNKRSSTSLPRIFSTRLMPVWTSMTPRTRPRGSSRAMLTVNVIGACSLSRIDTITRMDSPIVRFNRVTDIVFYLLLSSALVSPILFLSKYNTNKYILLLGVWLCETFIQQCPFAIQSRPKTYLVVMTDLSFHAFLCPCF